MLLLTSRAGRASGPGNLGGQPKVPSRKGDVAPLFHVFGYRGPQPLSCSFVADRVASPGPVHTRLTARQLAFTLRSLGFLVLAVEEGPGEAHRVRAQSEALIFDAGLNGPVGTSWYRMQLVLSCRFVPHANATLETANAFNAACGPARAIVNPGRSLRLEFVVPLHMGITEDYLRSALRGFADNMHELDFLVSSRWFEPELADALPNRAASCRRQAGRTDGRTAVLRMTAA
jgi:hypothetical protein